MAADAESRESENKVLSDVHVCLLKSESIDQGNGFAEPQKWLSRFYFWLPSNPFKIQQPSVTLNTSDQSCGSNIHNSFSKQLEHKCTFDSLKKECPELDEDGDIILFRKQTQNSVQSTDNFQNSGTIIKPGKSSCVTDVSLTFGKSENSIQNCDRLGSVVSVQKERRELLTHRDVKCESIMDRGTIVEHNGGLDTDKIDTCENTVTLPCKTYQTSYSGKLGSVLQGHSLEQDHIGLMNDREQPDQAQDEESLDYGVLTLEHSLETSLSEVGFQFILDCSLQEAYAETFMFTCIAGFYKIVWSGALLLCDYLIHNHKYLENSSVLDLGAGTGISSIVAAMFAPQVMCTDYLGSIVELSERNWERNRDLLPKRTCDTVSFKILDWTSDLTSQATAPVSKYTITSADLKRIEEVTFILAAEVIYDEELTDGLFRTIYNLLKSPPKTVLLSIEQRIVFSAENHDICSPAYRHFLENLEDLVTVDEDLVCFTAEKMSTEFPQYFQYQRVKELELWKISSHFHALI